MEALIALHAALAARGLSGRSAREAARSGKVRLGGLPVADLGRLVDPAQVSVHPSAPRMVVGRDLFVLHRDADLVVVVKPAGLLAVPAPGRRDPNVLGFVGRWFGAALPVHRLDEETSGLMLVALTTRAQDALKAKFEAHAIDRRYQAFVVGAFPETRSVDNELVRDRGDGLRGSGRGGKRAVTHFRRLEALSSASLVEARLETGRTHQVRIHLAESGHAILGDPLYASTAVQRRAPRLALHAYAVAFDHPFGGKLAFSIPLPDDLEQLRARLGRNAAQALASSGGGGGGAGGSPRRSAR